MITYMGYCGVGGKKDCSEVDANSVKWFKIDEVGVKDNGRWYLEDLSAFSSLLFLMLVHLIQPL